MPIRLSGMQSGLDTEALVSALVMGYRTKKEDYEKAQTKLSWKQDKWKSINTKITNFYTGTLASNKLTSAYNLKKATINNSSCNRISFYICGQRHTEFKGDKACVNRLSDRWKD